MRTVRETVPGVLETLGMPMDMSAPEYFTERDTFFDGLARATGTNAGYLITEMKYDISLNRDDPPPHPEITEQVNARGITSRSEMDFRGNRVVSIEAYGSLVAAETRYEYDLQTFRIIWRVSNIPAPSYDTVTVLPQR